MTSGIPKLSVLIITYNEAKHLQELLPDLAFADEVVIVDSFSTDKTKEITCSFPKVRFLEKEFENFTDQRNFAIDQAKNDWILFIDADERLTPEFKKELLETVSGNPKHSAYLVYRTFMFQNQKLNFSGWQTDKIYRLFNKQKARYTQERLVHEKLTVDGSIGIMKHKIIHYSYADFESYKQKMLSYGRLKAQEVQRKDLNPNFFHFYIKPAYKFLYQYLIRLGILDGKKGIIICYLNALSIYERYQELKRLNQKNTQTACISL